MSERLIFQTVLSPPTVTHAPEIHADKYQLTLPIAMLTYLCLHEYAFVILNATAKCRLSVDFMQTNRI